MRRFNPLEMEGRQSSRAARYDGPDGRTSQLSRIDREWGIKDQRVLRLRQARARLTDAHGGRVIPRRGAIRRLAVSAGRSTAENGATGVPGLRRVVRSRSTEVRRRWVFHLAGPYPVRKGTTAGR